MVFDAGPVNSKELILRLQWVPQTQFAGYYMAEKQGYYKEEELNIKINPTVPGISHLRELVAGNRDFVTAWLLSGIQLKANGNKIVLISQYFQKPVLMLLTLKSSGIDSVKKIRNKTMGVWEGEFQVVHQRDLTMVRAKRWLKYFGIICLCFMFIVLKTEAQGKDIIVSVANIPGHTKTGPDGKPTGGFIDLVKAMDDVYQEGTFHILGVFPFKRSFANLKKGKADIHLPLIKTNETNQKGIVFSSEPIAYLNDILYSNAMNPALDLTQLGQYTIDVLRGHGTLRGFKVNEISNLESGILKVANGRTDAFLMEQDAADAYIRKHQIKNIRRQLLRKLPVHIVYSSNSDIGEMDRIMTGIIKKLRKNGRLDVIMSVIHKPYDDWQPYKQKW